MIFRDLVRMTQLYCIEDHPLQQHPLTHKQYIQLLLDGDVTLWVQNIN
jgi:hypothetical protein